MRILNLAHVITLTSLMVAAGCASKDDIIPVPERDMKEVYQQHMGALGAGKLMDRRALLRRPMEEGDVDLADYTRTEATALKSRFKLLPNPTMYMYVAPHLATQNGVPIPGYLTEFKMWEKDHYALPGEISHMEPEYSNGGQ